MNIKTLLTACALLVMAWPALSGAQTDRYIVDLRAVGLLGDGVPANDIIGYGLGGRFNLDDGWFVGAELETYSYDFERPVKIVGLQQDPSVKTIDADATNTVLSAHLGRAYDMAYGPLSWHWSLGLGIGFPDVSDVTGPTSTGGTFDLTTKTSNEIHLMSAVGISYEITRAFSLIAVARAEHHFMDFQVTDRITGMTGNVDSQSPLGLHIAASWKL